MLPPEIGSTALDAEETGRYARHLSLPELGVVGQRRLKAASVLCVGAGGLGSPLLLYLAAAGIGRIGLIDFDVVDASNLQRQVIHSTARIGEAKVHSARARMLELNPRCDVQVHREALSSANALERLASYDLVCDGSDNFSTRYLVNDACALLGLAWVYGAVFRFEGQASVFNHRGGPDFRDLLPEPPPAGAVPSCAEAGVVGVLPGLIGTIQATEAIKLIAGIGTSLSGRLLVLDALSMRFRELRLQPTPGREPIRELIDHARPCAGTPASSPEGGDGHPGIDVETLRRRLESATPAAPMLLLDVRSAEEVAAASLPGALNIPLAELEREASLSQLKRMSAAGTIHVVCKAGGRSTRALGLLRRHGIEGINVLGGMDAWLQRGWPVESAAPGARS
ncbi:molybdopterin-synthase adenylyltransferase MoeB [Synechococcus sp. RSCCF101]|uniref:molybdopterin-synthase adenylyltransferase MoeB n=1 Tax=Synechococcus sp. RSCCF101 TaxID=2511069 RepID=UPI001243F440|nr:molybdopterin-synthase adenylyltransferase MoeB [Synechococcus sp. RSCCF101]QEY32158.1 molybdopterin-synthase adenylyltransferase MoeB [Synechococcus sp. RSCCF101]